MISQLAAFAARRYSVAVSKMCHSRTICASLLAVLAGLLPLMPGPVATAAGYPLDQSSGVIDDAVDYLLDEQDSDGSIGGFAISAWVVMALAAADVDPNGCAVGSGDSIVEFLQDNLDEVEDATNLSTGYARIILAAIAANEDPSAFGSYSGGTVSDGDFVEGLQDLFDGTQFEDGFGSTETLNDDFWAVIALEAAGEPVDSHVIDWILENQNGDGGWSWVVGDDSDVDDTAAAILALVAAGENGSSDEIQNALDFLKSLQNSNGGFPQYAGDVSNSASDAWAIMAIMAADGDPNGSEWEQNGITPVDHLLTLRDSDGHFQFAEGDDTDGIWNTAYAIPALLGASYPIGEVSSGGDSSDAIIGYNPDSLYFVATEGGEPPLERAVGIWNDGEDDLAWEADGDASWLTVTPSSGSSSGEEDEIEVSVDPTGLSAGTHYAVITITSTDADNSPAEVDVTLEVIEAESDAHIAVFPDELVFAAEEGEDDPDDLVLEVWNGGPGSMDWEVESDEDWLDVSPYDGSSDGEHDAITVSVGIDGLDADDYRATITITSDGADNSPVEIDVDLEIEASASSEEDPEIDFSPDEFEFEAEEGGDDPDEQTLEIWNDGDGELEWSVSSNADWLSLSPDDGTSTGEDDEVELSVDINDLEEGDYTARITISASGASTERVDVTLTIEAPDDGNEGDDDILILNTLTVPPAAGTITRSASSGPQGYAEGTAVQLTAVPAQGYAFTGWAGDASGTENPVTVTVSSDLNVTAYFVRFDASGVPNVSLTYASPEMALVSVIPYPVQSIPSSPKGFKLLSAYVVEPQGTGSFTLRFDGLTDAENTGVFKVVNGAWTQLPRAVPGPTAIEVTLPAEDPVLALARAGAGLNVIGRLQGLFGSVDPVILAVIIAGVVVAAFVLIALLTVRRRGGGDYYY